LAVADIRQEAIMRNIVHAALLSLACVFTFVPSVVSAQTTPPGAPPTPTPTPAPRPITYRGLETGVDVTAARSGEVAFYMGASSTRGSLNVRFAKMDPGESIPCSVGLMYEYLFGHNRARLTPVAGASFARVFSCAGDSDGVRPQPIAHSVTQFSGGARIPIFAGRHVVGSLKVLAFAERQLGVESASDVTSKGMTVGFVVGRR
jgi:hypothetical protein